jgi:hypothetical protein
MKTFFIFACFSLFSTMALTQTVDKKNKLVVFEKANLDDTTQLDSKDLDEEIREEGKRFLGFKMHFAVKNMAESSDKNEHNSKKKKVGYKLQVGFQLPKFIKTDPPNKTFKLGWNMGLRI